MPLEYDDIPGSWGVQSEGWPSTPCTIGKWLLCTKAGVVPYGSYVRVDDDLRVETKELLERLNKAYDEIFIKCRHLLIDDPALSQAPPQSGLEALLERAIEALGIAERKFDRIHQHYLGSDEIRADPEACGGTDDPEETLAMVYDNIQCEAMNASLDMRQEIEALTAAIGEAAEQ